MKKIAVLGCSFSHWYNDNHENWSHHIARDFPDTEVHCYAHQATGQDFFDYTMDYILSEKSYDCVIYQVSMPSRVTIPIYNPLNPNMNREWNIRPIKKTASDNFIQYEINQDIVNFNDNAVCPECVEGSEQSWDMDKLKNSFQYFHSLNSSTPEYFERRYIRHIQNLNKRYAKLFDNFFWYVHKISSVREQRLHDVSAEPGNIGQKYGAFNFMIEKFGNDPVKFFSEIIISEDDHHLTAYGNKLLYENYILKSKIGDYLNDKPV